MTIILLPLLYLKAKAVCCVTKILDTPLQKQDISPFLFYHTQCPAATKVYIKIHFVLYIVAHKKTAIPFLKGTAVLFLKYYAVLLIFTLLQLFKELVLLVFFPLACVKIIVGAALS